MSSSLCSCLFGSECQAMRSSLPLLLAGGWQMQSGTMCHAVGCCTCISMPILLVASLVSYSKLPPPPAFVACYTCTAGLGRSLGAKEVNYTSTGFFAVLDSTARPMLCKLNV